MRQRVLTASVLFLLVIVPLLSAYQWPLTLLAVVVTLLAHREVSRLVVGRVYWVPIVGTVVLVTVGWLYWRSREVPHRFLAPLPWVLLWIGLIGLNPLLKRFRPTPVNSLLRAEFASTVWLVIPILCMFWLHQERVVTGMWNLKTPIVMTTLPIWGGDIAAILVGKAIGRHPLAPAISPAKTWEGAAANLAACTGFALLIGGWIGLAPLSSLLCGLAAGVLGQVGDLYESYLKRLADRKDSGSLLPGHGGLLDRIDSMLFAAPAVALIVWALERRG